MPGSLAQGIFRITADSGAPDVGAIADLSCTSTAPRVASVPAIHPDLAERAASAPPNENNDVIENQNLAKATEFHLRPIFVPPYRLVNKSNCPASGILPDKNRRPGIIPKPVKHWPARG